MADYSGQVSGDEIGRKLQRWHAQHANEAIRAGCTLTRLSRLDSPEVYLFEAWVTPPERLPDPAYALVSNGPAT